MAVLDAITDELQNNDTGWMGLRGRRREWRGCGRRRIKKKREMMRKTKWMIAKVMMRWRIERIERIESTFWLGE